MKTTRYTTRFSWPFLVPVMALVMAGGTLLPGPASAISLPSLSGVGKSAG
ncbi:hypothetical protein S675_002893, partial [Salmonella enterica subsp. enterica]|nr:hypothetical protein [Salmonella enterica subsp. enterica]